MKEQELVTKAIVRAEIEIQVGGGTWPEHATVAEVFKNAVKSARGEIERLLLNRHERSEREVANVYRRVRILKLTPTGVTYTPEPSQDPTVPSAMPVPSVGEIAIVENHRYEVVKCGICASDNGPGILFFVSTAMGPSQVAICDRCGYVAFRHVVPQVALDPPAASG
jgi:hypothetical protein